MPDVGAKPSQLSIATKWSLNAVGLLGGYGRRDGREKRECRKDREKSAHEIPPTRAGIDPVPRALS